LLASTFKKCNESLFAKWYPHILCGKKQTLTIPFNFVFELCLNLLVAVLVRFSFV